MDKPTTKSKPKITGWATKGKCIIGVKSEGCQQRSGKVREILDLGDTMLFIATDRMSAYDVVMNQPIPGKGIILTEFTEFWMNMMEYVVPNAMITTNIDEIGEYIDLGHWGTREKLRGRGRSMLMRKCKPLAIECIVRGYLSGSGWKEYQKSGTVCGIKLPAGLVESQELPDGPIFTPSTKAETGHDRNITFEEACEIVGEDVAIQVRDMSLSIYNIGQGYAHARGIIIADTKFEFGIDEAGKLVLIDEVLTPDSSRFWPVEGYEPGCSQPSFDKQFLRDYLEGLYKTGEWNKQSPPPPLPEVIIRVTAEKYAEALRLLTE